MVDLSLQTLTHYLKLFRLPWSLEQLNGFVEHVIIDRWGKKYMVAASSHWKSQSDFNSAHLERF